LVTTTALYTGILAIISIVLGFLVGSARGRAKVSLGDGGDKNLLVAMRRHGNFTEFVPLIVAMLAIIELDGAPKLWIHVLGGALVFARVVHPFGLSANMSNPLRAIGAMLTAIITVVCGGILIWQGIADLAL
jgi:hypothetical protein